MNTRRAVHGESATRGIASTGTLTGDTAADAAVDPKLLRRAACASFIGNFVEWFDYASYGYLATIIAVVPPSTPDFSNTSTFAPSTEAASAAANPAAPEPTTTTSQFIAASTPAATSA